MSQYLAELCILLIEDTLGSFFAHIFSALTKYGRLEATQLAQKCRLPLRQIRHGLSVLVQAQLVYYHTSSDQRTSYEANLRAAYDLVRNGKINDLAKETLGVDAALVVAHILSVGQVTVKDLHRLWKQNHHQVNLSNGGSNVEFGTSGGHPPEVTDVQFDRHAQVQQGRSDLNSTLKRLVQNGFVVRSRRAHFRTHADNFNDAQSQLLAREGATPAKGRKGQEVSGEKVLEEMADRNDSSISLADIFYGDKHGSKRPATDDDNSATRKKVRLTNGTSSVAHAVTSNGVVEKDPLAETFVIRVNCDKVVALLRNHRLIDKVRRTLGASASEAYTAVLQQSTSIPQRSQQRPEPAPEGEEAAQSGGAEVEESDSSSHLIDQNSLLMTLNTLAQNEDVEEDAFPSQPHINGYVNGTHSGESAQTVTMNDVKRHLLILSQPPEPFVVQNPDSFCWRVDFRELSLQLRNQEAMRLAKSRLNEAALRLVRVLLDSGKLDEKTLQEKSLLSAKDLRQSLAKLKKTGFLGLQEVPKDPQRQPLRNIYLWFYDSDRVRKMLLGDLYKSMTRLIRRLKVERARIGALLEKSERIDVRGKEAKLLSRGELDVLELWRWKERWLLGEVMRLDDSVAILRDI